MAWHKPNPEIADLYLVDSIGILFEGQTCSVCGARRWKVKKTRYWRSWYRDGVGYIFGQCPGPPIVIEAIIVETTQRPGLIIDEGGRP